MGHGRSFPKNLRKLKVGELSLILDGTALRNICWRGTEVLRGISYLVRDKNWGTYQPKLSRLRVRQSNIEFSVTYSATCESIGQLISYKAKIKAEKSGRLVFSVTATIDQIFNPLMATRI